MFVVVLLKNSCVLYQKVVILHPKDNKMSIII